MKEERMEMTYRRLVENRIEVVLSYAACEPECEFSAVCIELHVSMRRIRICDSEVSGLIIRRGRSGNTLGHGGEASLV